MVTVKRTASFLTFVFFPSCLLLHSAHPNLFFLIFELRFEFLGLRGVPSTFWHFNLFLPDFLLPLLSFFMLPICLHIFTSLALLFLLLSYPSSSLCTFSSSYHCQFLFTPSNTPFTLIACLTASLSLFFQPSPPSLYPSLFFPLLVFYTMATDISGWCLLLPLGLFSTFFFKAPFFSQSQKLLAFFHYVHPPVELLSPKKSFNFYVFRTLWTRKSYFSLQRSKAEWELLATLLQSA